MMKDLLLNALVFILIVSSISCDSEPASINPDCPAAVLVSSNAYKRAPSDELSISSVTIVNDCITINFSSGGCDGSTWVLKLIDADVIMESYPVQRNLRLSLENKEECKAIISNVVSFDLTPIKLDYDKILLNITNSGDQILYEL